MNRLYDIDSSLLELLDRGFNAECIDEETGEIDTAKAQEYLDLLQDERTEKIESIALFIKDLDSAALAIKEEERKLKARRETKERKASVLREYLSVSMLAHGEKRFETAKVAMTFRKSETIEIADEIMLPTEYVIVKTTIAPNKCALKQAIKDGELIDGVQLVEHQNLQIK